jgi:hypothetical protein
MIVSIQSDSGAYVYGIFRDANELVANGISTEIYQDGHWANYVNVATEQGTSGHYQITVPSYLFSGSTFVEFYQKVGTDPAVGDTWLGSHNFTIPGASVTPTVSSDLVIRLRTLAKDTATSNLISGETLKPKPDGSRKKFFLDNKLMVTGSVYVTNGSGDANFRLQTGFSLDLSNGLVTFSVAPTANQNPFYADYNFYWFSDDDHATFLAQAAPHVSEEDPDDVQNGLLPALMQYALYYFYMARAEQFAHRYASSGGMASQSVDKVVESFMKLAATAKKSADDFRDMFYKKLGQQNEPATAIVTYKIDPFTPRR